MSSCVFSLIEKEKRRQQNTIELIAKDYLAKMVDSAVFPGIQGGALQNIVAAKAIADVRIGTAAETTKEKNEKDFIRIAREIDEIIREEA